MPGEDIYSWSTTAASNDDADTAINWREGQARASVNDSARSLMAALAKNRTLLAGPTIVTGGLVDAYTFTSGVGYTSIPLGMRVLISNITASNTGAATLNMDSIAATPIKNRAGNALTGGEWATGTFGEFVYDGTNWRMLHDTGTIVAEGNVTIGGTLTMTGGISSGTISTYSLQANNIQTAGAIVVGGTLTVPGTISSGIITTGALASTGNATVANDFTVSGNAFKPGGGLWSDTSDARIKNVVGDYTSGLAEVAQLNPVRYTFKGNDSLHENVDTDKEYAGLVAQDIEAIMPEMVTQQSGTIDGETVSDMRMLDTASLIYALVNSVKELAQRIEALEAKVP